MSGPRRRRRSAGLLRGRFAGGVHPALDAINRSLDVDVRLWRQDIEGSIAHARMLGARGIVPARAAARMVRGLGLVRREFEEGRFVPRASDEDIHMAVERRLTELIGEDGKRLHTARSRNDQVATDLRLHLRDAARRFASRVADVQRALLALARRDGELLLPYYTHLQRAQPVLLGHCLLAWIELLEQDRRALAVEPDECPLGAGAGTGTTYPIDRRMTAKALGFARPSANSIEAVAGRRDAVGFACAVAACAVTLSRLGGELVLWTSREFGFARLGDAVTTGSSIMPQKRNPDGAELLRALAVRCMGALGALLEIQRGLPLGYHKDLQEDKVALFGSEDALAKMLDVAEAMLGDVRFDGAAMRRALDEPSGYLLATEAADFLVRRGVSFREAHEAVGRLVREAEARGAALSELPFEVFAAAHAAFDARIFEALTAEAAVAGRRATGGTSPANVRRQIARWTRRLAAAR